MLIPTPKLIQTGIGPAGYRYRVASFVEAWVLLKIVVNQIEQMVKLDRISISSSHLKNLYAAVSGNTWYGGEDRVYYDIDGNDVKAHLGVGWKIR